jgi:2-methylcitrate dehydratase
MVYIKPIPAENNTIGVLELAPKIRAWTSIDEIEAIDIKVATGLDVHLADRPKYDPRNRETADHSFPYMLARALVDGEIAFDTYKPDRIVDPSIRPLMHRIHVHPNEDLKKIMTASPICEPEAKPARITVRTKSGQRLVEDVLGHSGHPDRPASTRRALINSKLDACAGAVGMPDRQREQIREAWWEAAKAKDVTVLMQTMQSIGSLRA